jgi:hypothetical protein
MQEHLPQGDYGSQSTRPLHAQFFVLVLCALFVIGFWIWFLFLRAPVIDIEKEAIQSRAIGEILAACNAAGAVKGIAEIFRPEDILTNITPPLEGVSAFVTTLGVSRNGINCHWDGINPARVTHGDFDRHRGPQP